MGEVEVEFFISEIEFCDGILQRDTSFIDILRVVILSLLIFHD